MRGHFLTSESDCSITFQSIRYPCLKMKAWMFFPKPNWNGFLDYLLLLRKILFSLVALKFPGFPEPWVSSGSVFEIVPLAVFPSLTGQVHGLTCPFTRSVHTLPRRERLSRLLLPPDPNPQLDINTEPDLNGKLSKCSPSRFAFPQTL